MRHAPLGGERGQFDAGDVSGAVAPARRSAQLGALASALASLGGVALLARTLLRYGWLWFLSTPARAVLLAAWLGLVAALALWSCRRCDGWYGRSALLALVLVGAALVLCVVVLMGGSARLVYRLATADV